MKGGGGGVLREKIESASAWRVTQIKTECGAGEDGRESRADERARDQARDKRYEVDVREGSRQEEEK